MPEPAKRKTAVVAALEREVRPLIKNWQATAREHDGRHFRFFEKDNFVLVCGGIGAMPARRAAEAVIALFNPEVIYSVASNAKCTLRDGANPDITRRVLSEGADFDSRDACPQ